MLQPPGIDAGSSAVILIVVDTPDPAAAVVVFTLKFALWPTNGPSIIFVPL